MKIYALNGSPRKNCNTAQLVAACIEGIKETAPDAAVETIHLYDYLYTGCKSCFACQMTENRANPGCKIKDSIHDALSAVRNADGIIIASPIYFFDITAQTKCFLERLLYPGLSPKPVPSVFIYTMNATEEQKEKFNFEGVLCASRNFMGTNFQYKPALVYSFNTFQYNDRENLSEEFRKAVPEKLAHQKEQFPSDLKNAREAGVSLAKNISKISGGK